jgi:hypothetical protein
MSLSFLQFNFFYKKGGRERKREVGKGRKQGKNKENRREERKENKKSWTQSLLNSSMF